MKSQGSLIIVSAPSGTGKTSLVNALLDNMPMLKKSVSHTTRKRREVEVDGQNYHFVDKSNFDEILEQNIFLEHAQVFGNFYGTSRDWVVKTLDGGFDVILEIDWQGAAQICKQMPHAVTIFILPPSSETLSSRLHSRNLDDADTIAIRLKQAKTEVSHYNEYEYLIVNDDFDETLQQLTTIVQVARLRTVKQQDLLTDLIGQLRQ